MEHYGRVPRFRAENWHLLVTGATADGLSHQVSLDELGAMPRVTLTSDLHCVRRWSFLGLEWGGVATAELLQRYPPADDVSHVLVWAEHGYSATLRIDDLRRDGVLLADALDGRPLPPDRGYPLRLVVPHLYAFKGPKWLRGIEYHRSPVSGFWEERGYHLVADPWLEQRYSHHE